MIRELIEGNEEGRGEKLEESGESAIWEHESLVAVVIAHTKFDLWRETATRVEEEHNRMSEAEFIGDGGASAGAGLGLNKVEMEVFEKSKQRERKEMRSMGKHEVEEAASGALVALEIVLRYQGGYLKMNENEVMQDEKRAVEIASLRKGLVPTVANLIVYLLCVTGAFYEKMEEKEEAKVRYEQAVDLAVTLSDPKHHIMECLSEEEAGGLMEKIAEAQVAVLRCEEK